MQNVRRKVLHRGHLQQSKYLTKYADFTAFQLFRVGLALTTIARQRLYTFDLLDTVL